MIPDSQYKLIMMKVVKQLEECFFSDGDFSWENPLIEDRKYWSKSLKDALRLHQDGGFPSELSPFIQNNLKKPIPAVDFSKEIDPAGRIGDILNKELKIYVTPTEFFTTKFRKIFRKTQTKFTTSKYARKWLGGPDMTFWPQQLSFALWCATTGCGVSRDILFSSRSILDLSPQVRSFYLFHVYFTTKRILYELGGIESVDALPDDPHLIRKRTTTTLHPTKKSVVSSLLIPALTFASHMGKTMGLAMCTFGLQIVDPGLPITTIQTLT